MEMIEFFHFQLLVSISSPPEGFSETPTIADECGKIGGDIHSGPRFRPPTGEGAVEPAEWH